MKEVRKVRVFVASPGDVNVERGQLSKVIDEINWTLSAIAPEKRVILELVRWETHVAPGLGKDAQDVVNRQIGDYDVFVGIMWKRFGTPTADAGSGTEEEFQRAYALWQTKPSLPVLFYFSQAPPRTLQRSTEEIEQLAKVMRFRDEVSSKGLVAEYPGADEFADTFRRHLTLTVGRMFSTSTPSEAAERSGRRSTAELDVVRDHLRELAHEYEGLRMHMPSGNERTRRMTALHAKLRAMAQDVYPLLLELTKSTMAGERLAAVATLQEIPTKDYLMWLADRVGSEKPFVGYQAARAILIAAQLLGDSAPHEVAQAITAAETTIARSHRKDPNQVSVLHSARRVIEERPSSLASPS